MTDALELPHTAGCLVCGRDNLHGLHLRLFFDPTRRTIITQYLAKPAHIGFDKIVHGGLLATILDEAMVWAATINGSRFCVCGEMNVRYRQSILVGQCVLIRARVESARSRLIQTVAEIVDPATHPEIIYAQATGKYVPMPIEQHHAVARTLLRESRTEQAAALIRGE